MFVGNSEHMIVAKHMSVGGEDAGTIILPAGASIGGVLFYDYPDPLVETHSGEQVAGVAITVTNGDEAAVLRMSAIDAYRLFGNLMKDMDDLLFGM